MVPHGDASQMRDTSSCTATYTTYPHASSGDVAPQANDDYGEMCASHIKGKWLLNQMYKELLKIEGEAGGGGERKKPQGKRSKDLNKVLEQTCQTKSLEENKIYRIYGGEIKYLGAYIEDDKENKKIHVYSL